MFLGMYDVFINLLYFCAYCTGYNQTLAVQDACVEPRNGRTQSAVARGETQHPEALPAAQAQNQAVQVKTVAPVLLFLLWICCPKQRQILE